MSKLYDGMSGGMSGMAQGMDMPSADMSNMPGGMPDMEKER